MSINLVVIVENSKGISREEFVRNLSSAGWAGYVKDYDWLSDDLHTWEHFEWERKRYFSWMITPTLRSIALSWEDDKSHHPDFENPAQITFLKFMKAVEAVAGGPIYVGHDCVHQKTPKNASVILWPFSLPLELDYLMPNWREVE